MLFHHLPKDEVLSTLVTNPEQGLSADQVSSLKEKYGENKLKEKKKKSLAARFFDQFKTGHSRHTDIGDNGIRMQFTDLVKQFKTVVRLADHGSIRVLD